MNNFVKSQHAERNPGGKAKDAEPVAESGRPADARATGRKDQSVMQVSQQRRDWLERGLKQLYDKTLEDPIPESFRALLEKLDKETGSR